MVRLNLVIQASIAKPPSLIPRQYHLYGKTNFYLRKLKVWDVIVICHTYQLKMVTYKKWSGHGRTFGAAPWLVCIASEATLITYVKTNYQ